MRRWAGLGSVCSLHLQRPSAAVWRHLAAGGCLRSGLHVAAGSEIEAVVPERRRAELCGWETRVLPSEIPGEAVGSLQGDSGDKTLADGLRD